MPPLPWQHQEDMLPMSDVEAQAIEGAALAHLRAVDPVLGRLIDTVGPFTLKRDPSHFYALFSSIVSQQISMRAPATIMSALSRQEAALAWAARMYGRGARTCVPHLKRAETGT